jgi:thioredoxin-related protein
MKKIFLAAMPLAVLAFGISLVSEPLPIGAPIPNPATKMKDVSGKEVSFQDVKTSKGLLVMFSCNTCPYVIKNQERTNQICKYAIDNGVGVVVLNSNEKTRDGDDSYDEMKAYASSQGYKWNYLVDQNSTMADAFGANRTPECFLFDGAGKLVYHGAIDDSPAEPDAVSRKHLQTALDEMNGGKEVSVKQSKSVGCTIKRL